MKAGFQGAEHPAVDTQSSTLSPARDLFKALGLGQSGDDGGLVDLRQRPVYMPTALLTLRLMNRHHGFDRRAARFVTSKFRDGDKVGLG